ncbi:MFS transporter [Paraburkholderia tropica]|uniref:MFS transporter n=1 Tax=Paraburkholderia tropica TaxID=92647 RepID=UPI002AB77F40|nr:MFS transporter [Paraburkholderia tropica]
MKTRSVSALTLERRTVALLALGFGLVGLDRFLIMPLFPQMTHDLHLTYQDLGNVTAALGMAWGVSAMLMGGLSDRIGRRKILIPALVLFSLLSGASGAATTASALILTRALMGVMEGAYCPASFAAADDVCPPERRGLNLGIIQGSFALFGLGLGPIIATQLFSIVPSWRIVFALIALPGLMLAVFMFCWIRDPARLPRHATPDHGVTHDSWKALLRLRNIRVAMCAILCAMSTLFVLGAITPVYLTDYRHLSLSEMGFVMSGLGFGGFVGQIAVCALSDVIGRKNAARIAFLSGCAALFGFASAPTIPLLLFSLLFCIAFFCCGSIALLGGPVAAEAAPASLTSSAVGLVIGTGEIFGGGVVPIIGGFVAQHMGLPATVLCACMSLGVGFFISFLLRETAPRKVKEVVFDEPLGAQDS